MLDPERVAAQAEARAMANRARVRARVDVKLIAGVLRLHRVNVQRRLDESVEHYHFSLADMLMLAHDADALPFMQCLIAELQLIMDAHRLSVSDVEAMSKRPDLADVMRMVTRPMFERLHPELMRSTGPENVQAIVVAVSKSEATTVMPVKVKAVR